MIHSRYFLFIVEFIFYSIDACKLQSKKIIHKYFFSSCESINLFCKSCVFFSRIFLHFPSYCTELSQSNHRNYVIISDDFVDQSSLATSVEIQYRKSVAESAVFDISLFIHIHGRRADTIQTPTPLRQRLLTSRPQRGCVLQAEAFTFGRTHLWIYLSCLCGGHVRAFCIAWVEQRDFFVIKCFVTVSYNVMLNFDTCGCYLTSPLLDFMAFCLILCFDSQSVLLKIIIRIIGPANLFI